jgi:serine/threonine-protein kinase
MPFVDGESLRDRLEREKRVPLHEAVRIIDQVASALTHAHGQGVIHRDIKPANILLAGDQAIVADFGIARAVVAAGGAGLTGTGLALGTPAYMSPEQAFDQGNVDGRTDVYAMGCVLFEMASGRTPFESKTTMELFARHASEKAPSLLTLDADVPLFIDRAVSRALAKEPEQRFDSPRAFADTLRSETIVAPVGRKRIAVLPPVNIRNDPEQQYLVLGLHEALISQLGRGDVAVLARTSVLQYQTTDNTAREICGELSAEAMVESSLLRVGDSVGIQARLVDGITEEGLWSGSFDGDVGNILSLYRGVHQQTFNPADLDRAMDYYHAALEVQPDYAPAYAGISLIWGSKIVLGMVPAAEFGPKWQQAAQRAVELDPNLAEGHQALAQGYTWFEFDWGRAEEAYKRALELDPNEPQARIFYSHFLAMLKRTEESDEQMAKALAIDPFNPFTQLLYGIQLGLTGRHEDAIAQLMKVPPNPLGSFGLSWQYFKLGSLSQGLPHYIRYFELLGDQEMARAMQDDGMGPEAGMIRGAETLVERSKRMFVKPNNIYHLFGWGGDIDRAVEWLERAYEMRDHEVTYMAAMGTADALRADPRFHELLRRLELPVPES